MRQLRALRRRTSSPVHSRWSIQQRWNATWRTPPVACSCRCRHEWDAEPSPRLRCFCRVCDGFASVGGAHRPRSPLGGSSTLRLRGDHRGGCRHQHREGRGRSGSGRRGAGWRGLLRPARGPGSGGTRGHRGRSARFETRKGARIGRNLLLRRLIAGHRRASQGCHGGRCRLLVRNGGP